MYVFESINENTEIRDNMLNDELDTTSILSSLSEEDSNSIVKSVNGVGFDANGNVLGQDGKVAMTVDDLRSNIKSYYSSLSNDNDINPLDYEAVEIDGTSYTINENGEAVDAEGKVFKTLDEVKAILQEHATDEPETIEEIMAAANEGLGIEFKDEEGNDLNFDLNTVDGMQARDKYIVDNLAVAIARETINKALSNDPDMESLYLYKQANGNADGWSPATDYSKVELLDATADGAEDQYKDIIVRNEVAQGRDADRAKQFAQYLIDDGKGEEAAKEALTNLSALDAAKIERDRANNQKAIDDENERVIKHWNSVETAINSGKVGDINIPAFIPIKDETGAVKNVPRKVLFEYMSKPVKDGLSANQLRKKSMTVEDQIVDAYLGLTKYSPKSLVDAKTKDNKIKLIRKIQNNNKGGANKKHLGGKPAVDTVVL